MSYRLPKDDTIVTPALAIYAEAVRDNIAATLRLLAAPAGWDVTTAPPVVGAAGLRAAAARWRPHVKTAKLAATVRELLEQGIKQYKCATTLELAVALEAGAADVLIAYPLRGPHIDRVRALARAHPAARVSALAEVEDDVAPWIGSGVGLFWDLNPGMDRTGAPLASGSALPALARMREHGVAFRGLHYYDGHLGALPLAERISAARRGYDALLEFAAALARAGYPPPEVVTAGTPALPCSLGYDGFRDAPFVHRVSPGTVVYGDTTSLSQLPAAYGYRPAALVLARVVSQPAPNIVTCDAGHKAVSAECGVPNCEVWGRSDLTALRPSEEHLPFAVAAGAPPPARGEMLYLVPRHVCPTVNNFDHALWIERDGAWRIEPVSARGHEQPLAR